MTPETKCVETIVITAAAAIIVIANKDMFFETRHVGCLLEKTGKANGVLEHRSDEEQLESITK